MAYKKSQKAAKRYRFELSRTSLFLWGLTFLVFFAWIFVLGVFVGKGILPQSVKATLRAPIESLHGLMGTDETPGLDRSKLGAQDPEFTFYEKLSSKREDAVKRDRARKETAGDPKQSAAVEQRPPELPDSGHVYTVQIASLDREENAAGLVNRLSGRGYPAYFYRVELDGRVFYRVQCGSFKTSSEAETFKAHLAQKEKIVGLVMRADSR
jgi:hypothetical protein